MSLNRFWVSFVGGFLQMVKIFLSRLMFDMLFVGCEVRKV